MRKITLTFFGLWFLFFMVGTKLYAQDSLWTLERSIVYAKANNLTIQQKVISERVAKMQWQQSKLAILPSLSLSTSYGRSFGRSVDPTSNSFTNTSYDFTGLNASAGVLLFGWFQKRNTIVKNDLLHQASEAALSQLQNDIALNVATGYLRILLAKEQILICLNQLAESSKQVKQTEALLTAGRSNGLDMAQVKTKHSTDSAAYIKAELSLQQAIIDMKALLNLEFQEPFATKAVNDPDIDLTVLTLDPEVIYSEAALKFGSIKSTALKVQSAKRDLLIVKSALYPQLNFSASSGTNYSSSYNEVTTGGQIRTMPWGKQIQNNFSQSIYLGISIPVFNGLFTRYAIKQAKIEVQNNVLQGKEENLKLKQEIYKACADVLSAYQTYQAAGSTEALALTGQDFAQKRYEKGLINASELLIAQNAAFKASVDKASANYDLIFKRMVIDYFLRKKLFK